ncbi:hypothetical protein C0993_011272 [Termitomyces sp. T159_Od127]|nr:hypothetical protein C0993_011272 [Termitomyces sp. T159_Od127]
MEITVLSGKNSISARKKAVRQKSRIKIAGFLENVEEAKRRILSQLERLVSELSNAFMRHRYHAVFTGGRDLGKPQDPQPVPSMPHQSERQVRDPACRLKSLSPAMRLTTEREKRGGPSRQASLANFHEDGVFSDKHITGIGNIAGRTLLHTIITSLEGIAFNGDPLQFLLVQTTYQPFISFFHQTGITDEHPEYKGIPSYSSAIVIDLRRGSPPDLRDFLRIKFKNGTSDLRDVHVFGHHSDIPLNCRSEKT